VILAPERSPRVAEAVAAARELLEREGPEGLTMRRLAGAMGIRAPSLYKHLESKEELEALLIAEVFREVGQVIHDAVARSPKRGSRWEALAELARVYRSWALAHPHPVPARDRRAADGTAPRKASSSTAGSHRTQTSTPPGHPACEGSGPDVRPILSQRR